MQHIFLNLDMNTVRKIMNTPHNADIQTNPTLLNAPEINPDKIIHQILDTHNTKYPSELAEKINKTHQEIDYINQEINKLQTQIAQIQFSTTQYLDITSKNKSHLSEKLKQFLSLFPEHSHDSILSDFDNHEKLLKKLQTNMNLFDKIFKSKTQIQDFEVLYSDIATILKTFETNTPNNLDETIKKHTLENNRKQYETQTKLNEYKKQLHTIQTQQNQYLRQHNDLENKMHQDIAQFLTTYETRHKRRKEIPATLNMQGLSEPVAFFQTIHDIDKPALEKLLRHAGLPVGYGPSEYIIRETTDITQTPCLELITPFYAPENARKNITAIMQYLAEHGASFAGVIKPATLTQINPTPENHQKRTPENDSRITKLIQNKLKSPQTISRDSFDLKYTNNENQYLFRGQTFMTSDPISAYATPTWRPGRTGLVYATNNPTYATKYASTNNTTNRKIAGATMNTEHMLMVNNHNVGFVTVFKNNKRNLMVSDLVLERIKTNKELKKQTNNIHGPVSETIISPQNNPIVARYMVVGDQMILIDEQDKQWHEIMDYMSPDLEQTHITATNPNITHHTQEQHGKQFLQRINAIQQEKQKNNNNIQTYDIPDNILNIMGYIPPIKSFEQGSKKISQIQSTTKILQNTQNAFIASAQQKNAV